MIFILRFLKKPNFLIGFSICFAALGINGCGNYESRSGSQVGKSSVQVLNTTKIEAEKTKFTNPKKSSAGNKVNSELQQDAIEAVKEDPAIVPAAEVKRLKKPLKKELGAIQGSSDELVATAREKVAELFKQDMTEIKAKESVPATTPGQAKREDVKGLNKLNNQDSLLAKDASVKSLSAKDSKPENEKLDDERSEIVTQVKEKTEKAVMLFSQFSGEKQHAYFAKLDHELKEFHKRVEKAQIDANGTVDSAKKRISLAAESVDKRLEGIKGQLSDVAKLDNNQLKELDSSLQKIVSSLEASLGELSKSASSLVTPNI